MKFKFFLPIIALSLMFAACTSTGSTTSNNTDTDGRISNENDYYRSLADYLTKVPGVNVRGSGENAYVTIRGISSFQSGNTPLYVVDGQAVGNSYSRANNIVNPQDIDYVRVLKGPDAAIYGVRGANGVIEIITKKT
ncbi:TonB-dependent receptor plug domain-containing protein [Rhodohalobacter sulfatireducens]|uniref:TonB-dependent receptor plug domain-containing protein n=1 Tax=Rhodohalobacter sulfatireducens TaxID=2911366 RepID=A0ABS9KAI3_9BACT|nr:TonB-dependent receptor plug domain-containing protein [Rhodohalobacter sulfatireducens]MCG2587827.1 TonB-dependent receptor plug domain-containing protein [Rhodohalobacter sulfatireducens]MDR9365776.1 TonB-dependent receptor plug domain-containing protein [Balneolaceae bacterium]